ncbi:helix-turn-helix domain-containing protein [Salinibacterium sp. GXW1014]|uniref:helix-turn-helix domain-containing protein n=1 Tax=Salinibacterium sp. GXW1014 TaxID=3377838 RepID=UPI003839EEF7
MSTHPESESWAKRQTVEIGARVRAARRDQGLSAQDVADRTLTLGHYVRRSVIADLENGRRPVLPVADLFAIALALNVPPLLLLFSVDSHGEYEVWDRQALPVWEVIEWFTGARPIESAGLPWSADPESDREDWLAVTDVLAQSREYKRLVGNAVAANRDLAHTLHRAERLDGAERLWLNGKLEEQLGIADDAMRDLVRFKEKALNAGLVLPEVDEPSADSSVWSRARVHLASDRDAGAVSLGDEARKHG